MRPIGTGGFGEVYEGRDPFIQRRVAIKTCASGDSSLRQRFLREAQIAGNLEHRNVVTIYDFGLQDEVPYIVQEYLPGEDLDHVIARRDPLSLQRRLDILTQVAEGLEYAHAQGVVHRDVKPANIRLLGDGRVKIMDFGIAKLAQTESQLTKTGITLGTAAYLPPEQIRGEPVDGRADQFSFGVTAYELLSGEPPFDGERLDDLMAQILNAEPRPLDEVAPQCPAALTAVVRRCLEKDPERRYASFSDVLAALRAVRAGLAPGAPSPVVEVEHQPTVALGAEALRPAPEQATRVRIEDLLRQGQLAAAEAELRVAERGPGGPAAFAELRQRVAAERERVRGEQLREHLDAARRALLSEDATQAQRECAAALTLDPMNAEAHAILGETRSLEDRHRTVGDPGLAAIAAATLLGAEEEEPAAPLPAASPPSVSPPAPAVAPPPLVAAPPLPALAAEPTPELPLAVELGEVEGLIAAGRLPEARAALDRLRPRVQGDEILRRQHGSLGAALMQAYAASKLPSSASMPTVSMSAAPPAVTAPAQPPAVPGRAATPAGPPAAAAAAPASGEALRFDLEELPELPSSPAPAAAPAVTAAPTPKAAAARKPWIVWAAGGAALMVVLAIAGLWLASRGGSPPPLAIPAPSLAPSPVAAPPAATALIVPSAPGSGLTVALDDAPPLPLDAALERQVPAGEHVLRFALPGKGEREVRVSVQAGERRLVDLPALDSFSAAPVPREAEAPRKPRPPRRKPTPAPTVPALAPPPAPPPPAPSPKPVERGDLVEAGPGVVPPKPLRLAAARYPEMGRRQGKEASIEVLVLVDENGKVIDARIQQGDPHHLGFDAAALEAARASTFQPATKDGVAVKMWRPLRIGFRLK
ncbi:MAG: TonB family protein [Acidobacteriota bacterium]